MPFLTDTSWPAGLLTISDVCRRGFRPFESRYSGPYNKLLAYCFDPDSFEYFVAPKASPSPGEFSPDGAVDLIPPLIVFDADYRPVLTVDIKDDGWITRADLRLKADRQIRQLYDALLAYCPLPRLWGLSLFGTSLRVCYGNVVTGKIDPVLEDRRTLAVFSPVISLRGRHSFPRIRQHDKLWKTLLAVLQQ